jgi:rRNA methylases
MTANEWKQAHRLLREVAAAPERTPERDRAALIARAHLASARDPHLSKLAPLLLPPVSDKQLLCALVPVERRASRDRLSDADLGITTADPPAPSHTAAAPMIVVADNIRSALNIGGIFRTSAFFGITELWLCGYTATPENPHVLKSAMGTEKTIPWRSLDSATVALSELRHRGYSIHALETASDAISAADFAPRFPAALLIGNERFGLDPETLALCDSVVSINGCGAKNSLNVVSALSIALFAASSH